MRLKWALVLSVVALSALPSSEAFPEAASITARPIATGLAFPAAFTFASDGRIFYGERFTGEIRILNPATGSDSLFFTISKVTTTGEHGLLGLALHPDYPAKPYVYARVTRDPTGTGIAKNQLVRITDSEGVGSGMWVMHSWPASRFHNGGTLRFGPDGKLYTVLGDRQNAANSQNLTNVHGKILRMNPWGTVPADNPFADSPIFAYGLRNSFGFNFDPLTGRLWETDNGPQCNDELNRIVRGGNHAWGTHATCSTPPEPPLNTNQDGPNRKFPIRWYATIVPTGLAFCSACGLPDSEGALFFGAWKSKQIFRVILGPMRYGVVSQSVVYTHSGRPLSMEVGPDGAIYFSDQTGIFKLVPP
jgi:glucose/arabinose dehydrogenase